MVKKREKFVTLPLIDVAIDDEFANLELQCIDLSLETCILLLLSTLWRSEIAMGHGAAQRLLGPRDDDDDDDDDDEG